MRVLISLIAVLLLVLIAYAGVAVLHLQTVFGIVIPYAAVVLFVGGMVYRILRWGASPVPFRIPTTAGQQKSLPWIRQDKLENPSSALHVIGRMALEVLLFRSLFRNLKMQSYDGGKQLAYGEAKWLWLAGLAFHYSFLTIFIRHFRFFTQTTPAPIGIIERLDTFFQVGVPLLYITDVVLIAAVTYLFIRRVAIPELRYVSLVNDYFPLFLILGLATSGVLMRYFIKTDVVSVKMLAMGLLAFRPEVPEGIGAIFYVHLFLLSVLIAYFPFSKLAHLGGVFMSPTRNMKANSREVRHVNPWNYPVHVHTYEEYENEFREKMKNAGLPVEKE